MLIRSGALDIIVIDSVAALVPRAEIEGEMGDSHVGLQARLMSQALRKITGALSNSEHHRDLHQPAAGEDRRDVRLLRSMVHPGDAGRRHAGEDRQDRQPEDAESRCSPTTRRPIGSCRARSSNWFDNGPTDQFLQFTVAKSGGNGRAQFAVTTPNHLIRTPGGWREAGELTGRRPGDAGRDRTGSATSSGRSCSARYGRRQPLARTGGADPASRFRLGHGAEAGRLPRLEGRRCSATSDRAGRINATGAAFVDFTPLPELGELQRGRLPRRRQEAPQLRSTSRR